MTFYWKYLSKPTNYVSSWGKQNKITREKAIEEISQIKDELPDEPVYIICHPKSPLYIEQDTFYCHFFSMTIKR